MAVAALQLLDFVFKKVIPIPINRVILAKLVWFEKMGLWFVFILFALHGMLLRNPILSFFIHNNFINAIIKDLW